MTSFQMVDGFFYKRRSQPPFLTLMVDSYYKATKNKKFLRWYLDLSWCPARHIIILQLPWVPPRIGKKSTWNRSARVCLRRQYLIRMWHFYICDDIEERDKLSEL